MLTYKMEDVKKIYEIKCAKYKAEDLTDKLKEILYAEALKEVNTMNKVNGNLS